MDKSEEEYWNEQFICPNHVKELITDWKSGTYRHLNRGTGE